MNYSTARTKAQSATSTATFIYIVYQVHWIIHSEVFCQYTSSTAMHNKQVEYTF